MRIENFLLSLILILIILYIFFIFNDNYNYIIVNSSSCNNNCSCNNNICKKNKDLQNYKYKNFKLYYPSLYIGGQQTHKWDNNGILQYGSINIRKQPLNNINLQL